MADEINRLFTKYLINEKEKNWPEIQTIIDDKEALKRIEERYLEAANEVSPEYLFGIKGFNNTPKLLFGDLLLCSEFRDKKTCFSIDMKNTIDTVVMLLNRSPGPIRLPEAELYLREK